MKTTRARKKNLLIRLCVFAFTAYVVVSLVSLQMEITSKRSELAGLQTQLEAQQNAVKDIERQLSYGDDDDFLARIARDKLEMGRSDERVFRDASGS